MKYNGSGIKTNVWSKRFIVTAMVHASVVIGLTIFLVLSQVSIMKPAISRVIAAGDAGTWFTFGFTMYMLIGVVGMAISGLFYYYIEVIEKRSYSRTKLRILAWINFALMNVGIIAAAGMLMYGGYNAQAAMLPTDVGGKGLATAQAHAILGPLSQPIAASILVTAGGAFIGIIGFVASYTIKHKSEDPPTMQAEQQRKKGETATGEAA